MAEKKKILVACGMAVATSVLVSKALEDALQKRGIAVSIKRCKASEIAEWADEVDLIITTTPVPPGIEKPVIQTLAFLTGIGKDAIIDRVVEILESSEQNDL